MPKDADVIPPLALYWLFLARGPIEVPGEEEPLFFPNPKFPEESRKRILAELGKKMWEKK